jgi:hypothetical protein
MALVEVGSLIWQLRCSVGLEVLQQHKLQCADVAGLEHNRWGVSCLKGLSPTADAEAPLISRIEAREVILRHWSGEVVPGGFAVAEKLRSHDGADGVQPLVIWAGATVAIAVKSRVGTETAGLKRIAEDVGRHSK